MHWPTSPVRHVPDLQCSESEHSPPSSIELFFMTSRIAMPIPIGRMSAPTIQSWNLKPFFSGVGGGGIPDGAFWYWKP